MILCKLRLENFKRYSSKEITFDEGLVGIIGKNGSGKSTIFEAILFALYGELQNKGYKEIVRNANATTKDAVVVELDFEFDNTEYKIIREFRGKALSANAKLYKTGELITSGAKEVSTSIIKLTSMNKEAFLSTLFASQKELTSLSSKKPEDRKKMIRKLLGLEKIDFIEKDLIERSRELKREIATFAEVLLSEEELQSKTDQIKEKSDIDKSLAKEAEVKAKELDQVKLHELGIRKELDIFIQTKDKKQKTYNELELLQNTINAHKQNQIKYNNEINNLKVKQEELKGLESIKIEYIQLHESLKEQDKLKEIALRKEGLQKEQVQLREQYTKSKNTIATLKEQVKDYDTYIQDEKQLTKQLEDITKQINKILEDEKNIHGNITAEKKQIDDINQKINNIQALGRESACPTCTRPLREEYDNVLDSLNSIINESQNIKIANESNKLEQILQTKQNLQKEQSTINTKHFELSKSINLIENKKRDLQKEQTHFEDISAKGMRNKKELENIEGYSYDKTIHEELLTKYNDLKSKYEYILSLEAMLKSMDKVQNDLISTTKAIDELSTKYNDKELEYKQIDYDEVKHKQKEQEYNIIQKDKENKTTKLNELKVNIATLQGEIKTIQQSLDNNAKHLAKVQNKKDDLKDYDKIKISLGEFKTKLNSKIAPRISSFASDMYSRITKGKYQHMEVSNDFDFFIYDEGAKYPIERFSGGEIDLANLVLRIAISKTLRELSGASSIGFLAFDEVFGSQDEARRMEILEAFHTIKEQYRQIFLISHELEIKEMFERLIEL